MKQFIRKFNDVNLLLRNFAICNTTVIKRTHVSYEDGRNKIFNKIYLGKSKFGAAFCALFGCGAYFYITDKTVHLSEGFEPDARKSYPLYTVDEIRKHFSIEDRIWVTYKDGVYDITDFVNEHPGGNVIMMAAGNAIDPFWALYGVHKQPHILSILEKYRIGSISKEESLQNVADLDDPYADEPERPSWFIVNSEKPFNAEPPLPFLVKNFITPSDIFYVRNHLPVPRIDEDDYELQVTGIGIKETKFTLNDLKTKFPKTTVTATIMCAGNRRNEMKKIKPVKGLNWSAGAVGNAVWSGARLHDVLRYCGLENYSNIRHIQFEGLDTDAANVPYGASIPINKLMNPYSDVILAYEMNSESLPRDHGFPVRVIIPGVVGARNVKWLGRIILSNEESSSHWQQNDYKGFSPSVDWTTVDFKSSNSIQELPVISAICDPIHNQKLKLQNGKLIVSGYAWSGGGCKIWRVDITVNGGAKWIPAEIVQQENADPGRCWSWVLWKAEIPVEDNSSEEVEIWAKAVDSNYNVQPESFANIWNLRGVLANAYHRIKVQIEK